MGWTDFAKYLKEKFPNLNKVIQNYFSAKYVNPSVSVNIPSLSGAIKEKGILNTDILSIFCLTDPSFYSLPKLNLLHSTETQGKSFLQIANAIKSRIIILL